MIFTKNITTLNLKHKLIKQYHSSSGTRNIWFFKNLLPLQIKSKQLEFSKKWNAGRNKNGRMVMWTRKSLNLKIKKYKINYSFRSLCVGFIGSIIMLPFSNKTLSLLFLSSGSITYVTTNSQHRLFQLTKFYSILQNLTTIHTKLWFLPKNSLIPQNFFILMQLPKNQPISLLEIIPGKGIQYVRSSGTQASTIKIDTHLNTSLIKLPSGVRKVFSTFSLASLGQVSLNDNKLALNNKAGHYSRYGIKSITRGVAMNPVDHPHGGRAKSVKYQRTPWGKTTKFK